MAATPAPAVEAAPGWLSALAGELEEIAGRLRAHAAAPPPPPRRSADPIGAPEVRAILAARRLRARYLDLPPADPAWTLLLHLYIARLEGRPLCQHALGTAAALPETTALRTTRKLAAAGLVHRRQEPTGHRRQLLTLPDEVAERIGAYLEAVLATETPLV
jgi:DNA-binding MarR family transcriptional regulator